MRQEVEAFTSEHMLPEAATAQPSFFMPKSVRVNAPLCYIQFLGEIHYLIISVSQEASFCQSVCHVLLYTLFVQFSRRFNVANEVRRKRAMSQLNFEFCRIRF